VRRLKLTLCLLAAATAAALAVTPPATAAPTGPAASGTAAPALVPATGKPAMVTRPAGAATNATQDGTCDTLANGDGEFCLWFGPNFASSLSDFFNSDGALGDNTYLSQGDGLGQIVSNNSQSAANADFRLSVAVFTGANGTGAAGVIAPRAFGNFNATFVGNVESFRFV
jgi:Peptidase inhibitor family I36